MEEAFKCGLSACNTDCDGGITENIPQFRYPLSLVGARVLDDAHRIDLEVPQTKIRGGSDGILYGLWQVCPGDPLDIVWQSLS